MLISVIEIERSLTEMQIVVFVKYRHICLDNIDIHISISDIYISNTDICISIIPPTYEVCGGI